jgi:hypothetical protein
MKRFVGTQTLRLSMLFDRPVSKGALAAILVLLKKPIKIVLFETDGS